MIVKNCVLLRFVYSICICSVASSFLNRELIGIKVSINCRAHLNDMENIIPFIGLIFVYAISGAGDACCITLVSQIFTAARVLHTIVYLNGIRQPT